MTQALEQMLSSVPRMEQERPYQTIDVYTSGLSQMYTGPIKPITPMIKPLGGMGGPMINRSLHIYKPYGQHENKLIDYNTESTTTVYSNFKKNELKLDVFHNDFKESHKDKICGIDINLPYNGMFKK